METSIDYVKSMLLELINKKDFVIDYLLKHSDELYDVRFINKNGKRRKLEIPKNMLKAIQSEIALILQQLTRPKYCMAGYKHTCILSNARYHAGANHVTTMDIKSYYPSTNGGNVLNFFSKTLGLDINNAKAFTMLCTYNGHLPTGAPTSPLLAFWSHYLLFEEINRLIQKQAKFSAYFDDITVSSKHELPKRFINRIKFILRKHRLQLNPEKTKCYGFKGAHITGMYINQAGKVSVPFKIGNEVSQMLKETPISNMDLSTLEKVLGYISYARICNPKAFQMPRKKVIREIKKKTITITKNINITGLLDIQKDIIALIYESTSLNQALVPMTRISDDIKIISKDALHEHFKVTEELFLQLIKGLQSFFNMVETADNRHYSLIINNKNRKLIEQMLKQYLNEKEVNKCKS